MAFGFSGFDVQEKDKTYTWIDDLNRVVPFDAGGFGGNGSFGGSGGSLFGGQESRPSTVLGALGLDGLQEGTPSPFDIAAAPGSPSGETSQSCRAKAEAARQACIQAAAANRNPQAQQMLMKECQANYERAIARCGSLPVAPGTIPEF